MAILPGSLDYLYYNGILDHIPYEAYEMSPMTPSGMMQMSGMGTAYGLNPMMNGYGSAMQTQMNGSQYLKSAQGGLLYDTYTYPDTFVRRSNNVQAGSGYSIREKAFSDGKDCGRDADYEVMANGREGKNFRLAIMDAASKTKDTVTNSPNWVKGILAGGIMLTTLSMLLKGKKKVSTAQKSSLLSKMNPINWFKK